MRLFYLTLFVIYSAGYSQSAVNAIVQYNQVNKNEYISESYKCELFIQNDKTIFLRRYNTTKVNHVTTKEVKPTGYPDWEYLQIDHQKQQILLFDAFGGNKFLVFDSYNKPDWLIDNETKTIGGYSCVKATTTFRGVQWVVWFAPEIPLPYGPWKLYGLPGLILEATEGQKPARWTVDKIEYRKSDIFDKDFASLNVTKNKEPMGLRDFLEGKQEWTDNVAAEMKQNSPTSTIYTAPVRGGFEEKYEWENR